jgi:amino acid adenylation domain-containing protein
MKTSIFQYFEETACGQPKKTAVIDGDLRLTFGELRQAIYSLATVILAKDLPSNSVVAVLLKKSAKVIVADLAITAIGCTYMNLDVKSPAARIKKNLDAVRPALLITDSQGLALLNQIPDQFVPVQSLDRLINLDEPIKLLSKNPGRNRLDCIIDTDPYCIINTSGSTGVPKGVVLNHRSFVDFIQWSTHTLDVDGTEVVGSLSPVIFDIFSFELCMLAFKGSCLCLIDERLSPYPAKILEVLEQNQISFIFWVPTIMVNIANMGLLDRFVLRDLRTVWFAGEVFPTVHFNKWFDRFPTVKFVNLYGPIEITLDCTYYIIQDRIPENQPIPMGYPCRNTALLILNEDGSETQDGEIGGLCVRGASLAMGYYNNPEQTAKAFVQNPLNSSYPEIIYRTGDLVTRQDGIYQFKGRADTMVKHLGYRIELADIEHAILASVSEVRNVCVIYSNQRKEITAYCELSQSLTFQVFRAKLGQELPNYMVPSKLVEVDQMPMNANGKIDRAYFKKLAQS